MHVLVVEDSLELSSYLKRNFAQYGFTCLGVFSAPELSALIESAALTLPPDFVLLDRLLQEIDVSSQIPQIKKAWPLSRIIVLSAIGGPRERARILDLGADEYMNKPFEFVELYSRIKKWIDPNPLPQKKVKIPIRIWDQEGCFYVQANNMELPLTKKEFLILQLLMDQPNRVISKFKLLDAVWESNLELESNVVEVTIRNLRIKLEKSKIQLKILNRRNLGYWLET